MKRFDNQVVIVTGASSGIGEALVREFAALGANVVAAARSKEKLEALAAEFLSLTEARSPQPPQAEDCKQPTAGRELQMPNILTVTTDVSREEDCRRLVDETVKKFGRIDILICNAGISMRAAFDDVDLQVLERLMDTNFWGTVYCAKYALPYLQKSHGSIVGVSSVAGLHGLPGRTGYSASKYAMTGFLETLRIENLHKNLHVMVACPGFTATNVRLAALTKDGSPQGRTPRQEGKMMSAEEVARRIIRGIRRRKRLLLMEWEGRATHFIKKFAPGLLDRLFYMAMAREPDSPLQ